MDENDYIVSEKDKKDPPFSEVRDLFSIALNKLQEQISKNQDLAKRIIEQDELIEDLSSNLGMLEAKNKELEEKNEQFDNDFSHLQSQFALLNEKNRLLNDSLNELSNIKQENLQLQQSINEKDKTLSEMEFIKQALSEKNIALNNKEEQINSLKRDISLKDNRILQMEHELQNALILKEEIQELRKQNELIESQYIELNQAHQNALENLSIKTNQLEVVLRQIQSLEQNKSDKDFYLTKLESEILLLQSQFEQSENKNLEHLNEISDLIMENENLKNERIQLIDNFRTKSEENELIRTQLNNYKEELEELRLKSAELSDELIIKNQAISEYANHIKETEAKIIATQNEVKNIKENGSSLQEENITELTNKLIIEQVAKDNLQNKIKDLEQLLSQRYEQIRILENDYEQQQQMFESKINRLKNKLLDLKKLLLESN